MPRSISATGKSTSFIAAKHRVIQPVQADRHALRPACLQRRGIAREQRAIAGERQVQRVAVRVRSAASCSISTSMFLRSRGSPPVRRILRTPCATNWRCHAGDFFKRQQRRMGGRTGKSLLNTSLGMQ